MPLKPPPEGLQPLRAARIVARLAQWELGRKIGLDQTGISRMETGTAVPTRKQLVHLCKALNRPPEELFTKEVLAVIEQRTRLAEAESRRKQPVVVS